MKVTPGKLSGLLVVEPRVHGDPRGYFLESWSGKMYESQGMTKPFVQDNLSKSPKGVLRGLHYQHPKDQGKLVTVLAGKVFDVAVDIRKGSPTFGQWEGQLLTEENHKQFYIPPGFAHGFEVLSEFALFYYKCTEYYHPEHEHSLLWNDPDLNISWSTREPSLSAKDAKGVRLKDLPEEHLPEWG